MSFMNVGSADRIIRVGVGVTLLVLGWGGVVEGGWGTFLGILGFVPLLTGLAGWCPLYRLAGLPTRRSERQPVEV